MTLRSIRTNKKSITYKAEYNSDNEGEAHEVRQITSDEMPTKEFTESLGALSPVVCSVMGWDQDYAEGMKILGYTIKETEKGTRSIRILCKKPLKSIDDNEHQFWTPFFRIDDADSGETGSVNISKAQTGICAKAILEGENYAEGKRSQLTFTTYEEQQAAIAEGIDANESKLMLV